jgi:AraC family transcriptional regulator
VDCPRYGVALDDSRKIPPAKCRYDACVELPPGLTLPDAESRTLAGGRYAVTTFKGTSAQIAPAWGAFLAEFHGRGLALDDARQPLEHYPRGAVFDARFGVFACELCLPVGS